MHCRVAININGKTEAHEIEPRLLLVHFIRECAGLTGTHVGCDTSQCGACTIGLNGLAVKSCTKFAVQADGAEIVTIEGLSRGDTLHPLQQAFRDHHGLQCGFCTPGMLMAAKLMLDRHKQLSEELIRHELEGNICRCTGYVGIVKAIMAASIATAASDSQPDASNAIEASSR
ncbi:MAG TPA: (2Fe-2S)-binding protein [Roseiarcus sp.]|jgi:carbon-monoxide dehydrogenase small subunit